MSETEVWNFFSFLRVFELCLCKTCGKARQRILCRSFHGFVKERKNEGVKERGKSFREKSLPFFSPSSFVAPSFFSPGVARNQRISFMRGDYNCLRRTSRNLGRGQFPVLARALFCPAKIVRMWRWKPQNCHHETWIDIFAEANADLTPRSSQSHSF